MRTLALALALSVPAAAVAQDSDLVEAEKSAPHALIYGWADARGVWHFVDSLALVPAAYRRQAEANAVAVAAIAGTTTPQSTPTVTRRTVERKDAPEGRRPSPSQVDARTRARIAELEADRARLQGDIAVLEEGSAPASYVEKAGDAPIDEALLGEWLSDTEQALADVERELGSLGAAP